LFKDEEIFSLTDTKLKSPFLGAFNAFSPLNIPAVPALNILQKEILFFLKHRNTPVANFHCNEGIGEPRLWLAKRQPLALVGE
jgi:hypothetical protein